MKKIVNAFKLIVLLAFVAVIAATFMLWYETPSASRDCGTLKTARVVTSDTMTDIVTLDELDLPEDLVNSPLGLFFYNGSDWVRFDSPSFSYDSSKQTFIFIHGMGSNQYWDNADYFFNHGYNIGAFVWGALADEEYMNFATLSEKVWFCDGDMRWKKDGVWQDGSDVHYSVAEIFSAYYLAFCKRNSVGRSGRITLGGHSYGGMTACAVLSYLITAYDCGLLEPEYLPDSVLLMDPFFVTGSKDVHVSWLGGIQNPVDKGGVAYLSEQAVSAARDLGISVALIRTTLYVEYPLMLALGGEDELAEFYDGLLYVRGLTDELPLDLSAAHVYSNVWPSNVFTPVYDANDPSQEAYSLFTSFESKYARMGTSYTLSYNKTVNDFTDDTMTSSDIGSAKICGFVFLDENRDGKFDERLYDHFHGAAVSIKDADGAEIFSTVTGKSGYYEKEVPLGTYTVTVTMPDGYVLPTSTAKLEVTGDKQLVCSDWGAYTE